MRAVFYPTLIHLFKFLHYFAYILAIYVNILSVLNSACCEFSYLKTLTLLKISHIVCTSGIKWNKLNQIASIGLLDWFIRLVYLLTA